MLEKEFPANIKNATSLLGVGRQSLLRNADLKNHSSPLLWYATRRNGMPLADPHVVKVPHNIGKNAFICSCKLYH